MTATPRERARELYDLQSARRWALATSGPSSRIARLRRLRENVLSRREALFAAVAADFGKAPVETELTELHPFLLEVRTAIARLPRWMKPRRVGTPLVLFGTGSEIRCEARGVVAILGAWNYPFGLVANPLVAALAAGNAVLLHPSDKAPATAAFLEELVLATFPEDEVAVLRGGVPAAEALLELPLDHVFFTGSPAIGRKVAAAAARHLASVTLELGGRSPAVVDEGADPASAARSLAWGKLVNGGQTCIAPDHVLVHAPLAAALVTELGSSIRRAYGDDATRSADFARIVDRTAFDHLRHLLDDAVSRGAHPTMFGTPDREALRFPPVLLEGVPEDAEILRREIFGPILPILPYRTLDEAILRIRTSTKPLAMYVFAPDARRRERLLRETTAGGTVLGDTLLHYANGELPFGGVGESGSGSYHGEFGFRTFSHERAVLRQGPLSLSRLTHPPYAGRTAGVARLLTRFLSR